MSSSNFKSKTSRSVGVTLTAIGSYTVPIATQCTAIGLTVCNSLSSQTLVNVDVTINDGVNDTYIIKNTMLPSGSSLVIIGGEQKVVLETGYSIKVRSDTANSVDAVLSILEIA